MDRLDTYHFYERRWANYSELREWFQWEIPDRFNKATYICDRWANADESRVAVYADGQQTDPYAVTFEELRAQSDALASSLRRYGIGRGDRIAVCGGQRPETLVAHLATWKIGGISVPMSALFGPDAMRHRLCDSGAMAYIVDESNVPTLESIRDSVDLDRVITVGERSHGVGDASLREAVAEGSNRIDPVHTSPDDPAVLLYTSGTTGKPKGVILAHQTLLGDLPSFIAAKCNMVLRDDDVHWTPSEWAWVGSIYTTAFTSLFYGLPVVTYQREQFDPHRAADVIESHDVTVFSAAPAALRRMKDANVAEGRDLSSVRVVAGGGAEITADIRDWAEEAFSGAAIHQLYGQTEANLVVGECTQLVESRPGSDGLAGPGHDVQILDVESGEVLDSPDVPGEIAVKYDDPVCFSEYWNDSEATEAKIHEGWLLTGDIGSIDEDGYVTFHHRKDDLIVTNGYRVGPGEIESVLETHAAVSKAAVVGIPDDERGQVPKAFVVLSETESSHSSLIDDLQDHARENLALYKYPRAVEFRESLPQTQTGKIKRTVLGKADGDDPSSGPTTSRE
ncbi:acyl-CoA synthetase [Natrarchaeobius chitinivorans]|uniref:AMP-dependent synthetase n=1 Tax=Natrarchaeobius chitinivorans TaxID=1679083 RepID=A0A3N6PE22_NATCH|nr:AMP-binding protein [Natrarchaeobius chitinivorans]RQG95425.1 AMP-dependent synthetase [Natrarchaeobius chitinivorans]